MAEADHSWYRKLADGRIEVLVRTATHRLRASGPEAYVYALVELFEEQAGATISGNWARPPRRGKRPLPGSISLFERTDADDDDDAAPSGAQELSAGLSSDATVGP